MIDPDRMSRLVEYNRVMDELKQAELTPEAHLLLQAVRDAIAAAPEAYDERRRALAPLTRKGY